MTTPKPITISGDTYELGDDFLAHVLETAVEGACSYWADITAHDEADHDDPDHARDFDVSDYVDDDDNDRDDGDAPYYTSASFTDAKDSSKGGTVDFQNIADAIERIGNNEVEVAPAIREIIIASIENDDPADIDAEAADCIVQIALFDEIVYS